MPNTGSIGFPVRLPCVLYCLVMLYKAMVRSHLEYANTVWSPVKQGDIDMLEKVQKRFTKMIPSLTHLGYSIGETKETEITHATISSYTRGSDRTV